MYIYHVDRVAKTFEKHRNNSGGGKRDGRENTKMPITVNLCFSIPPLFFYPSFHRYGRYIEILHVAHAWQFEAFLHSTPAERSLVVYCCVQLYIVCGWIIREKCGIYMLYNMVLFFAFLFFVS